MREDLSPAQQAVQACHACIEFARHLWPPEQLHPHLVLLRVDCEQQLLHAAARLEQHGILYRKFCEPDFDDTLTAVATQLLRAADPRRKLFRRYRCLSLERSSQHNS